MAAIPMKDKTYVVKRYVLEEYEVIASNKEDAIQKAIDPISITVVKETIKIKKHER